MTLTDQGMSIDQMAEIFHDLFHHYGHVRLFRYENFHHREEEFTFFSADPKTVLDELTNQVYPNVSISCYSKEQPAYIYIEQSGLRIEVEFY